LPARNEAPFQSRLLIAAAISLGLFTCAFSADGWFQPVSDEHKVEAGIQQIRQLKLKASVPIFHKTRAQVAQLLLTEMKDDKTQQADAEIAAGEMLGRFRRASNIKEQSVKLYVSQIAAYYDSRRKQMIILDGPRETAARFGFRFVGYGDWRDDMILAHELTHALQDQNFNIGSRVLRMADNSDAVLAFKSLIEGDATLAGFAYVRGGMDESLADFITAHLTDLPQVSAAKNVPDALSVPLLFQYSQGTAFVREAYRRGGWDSVDAAFRNPPESSAQIIDPSLYFDHPTHPVRLKISGYEKTLAGWNKEIEDTYGELALRLILQMSFGRDSSQVEVARRWAGDRMVVLSHGKDQSVIWMIAFTDEQGAALFADFYRTVLDHVDGQSAGDEDNLPIAHDLQANGKNLLVIAGPAATQFSNLAPAIWQASKVTDLNPPPPPGAADADDDQSGMVSRTTEYLRGLARDWLGIGQRQDPLKVR